MGRYAEKLQNDANSANHHPFPGHEQTLPGYGSYHLAHQSPTYGDNARAVGDRRFESGHARLDVKRVKDVSCCGTHLKAALTSVMSGARGARRASLARSATGPC
eukprot:6184701-Pleurochrysis_carterae.AAC.4